MPTDVKATVWDGTKMGDDVQVIHLDDDCYPTCTGATWGTNLSDGAIVLQMRPTHQTGLSFGGPAALLIGKPKE